MRPASFSSHLNVLPQLSKRAPISRPKRVTPWICHRCHSRFTRNLPPKDIAGGGHPRLQLQILVKQAPFSQFRRHASSSSPKPSSPDDSPPNPSTSLPSHTESLRSPLSHRFTHLMDSVQTSLFTLPQHLNHLTGYTGIESLKASIAAQEANLETTRSVLAAARTAYSSAIKQRSASQREVNELLQRKHIWSPADLERFTELYRSDHANELHESQAHEALTRAEKEAEEAGANLSECILKRYHEEQIWSDKIRRMSTWGTWGLMGVNVLLFLVFQIGVEPWRRRRLVKGFEEKVQQALEREKAPPVVLPAAAAAAAQEMGDVVEAQTQVQLPREAEKEVEQSIERHSQGTQTVGEATDKVVDAEVASEVAASTEVERLVDPEIDQQQLSPSSQRSIFDYKHLRDSFRDLFSERPVSVRQWDLTALALQGAAAGMAFVGLIVVCSRPR
ncbi:MAG: hypothetical protein Q9202_001894 [Teloschistes flavicans]